MSWPRTQGLVAKPDAEAELDTSVRASSETLRVQTLLEDMGCGRDVKVVIHADAAKSTEWEALGKARRIQVYVLWLQY